ncbi:hypothetical protein TNCV_3723191 [Trichonephila clavipes]|nr:hypothetical protein TNCV_3723191 [Trichonephila clavipes]
MSKNTAKVFFVRLFLKTINYRLVQVKELVGSTMMGSESCLIEVKLLFSMSQFISLRWIIRSMSLQRVLQDFQALDHGHRHASCSAQRNPLSDPLPEESEPRRPEDERRDALNFTRERWPT